MKKVIKSFLIFSIILFLQTHLSCSKKEEILDLNADYLTVTDVIKYCERECDEELDLKGESVKVKGHLKRSLHNKFIYNQTINKVVFFLKDIRNSKVLTIQIMNDSINIANKLNNVYSEMIFLNGKVLYDDDATSNKGCSKDLFIEIFNANDIKIN